MMVSNDASMHAASRSRPIPQPDSRRSGGQMFSMRDPDRKSKPLRSKRDSPQVKPAKQK